jgi:phage RecT family recombinase
MSNLVVKSYEGINKLKPKDLFELEQVSNMFKKIYGDKEFENNLEKEKLFALQIIAKNPKLQACESFSIYTAIMNLAVCKITLNPALKQATIINYGNKAELSIMYQGKVDILTGIGAMRYIKNCEMVYDCDQFEINMGVVSKHIPDFVKMATGKCKMIGGYIIVVMPDGKEKHLFMREDQFLKRREKAPSKSIWDAWPEEMRRKSLINQIYSTMPKTARFNELAVANAFKDTVETTHEVVENNTPEGIVLNEDEQTHQEEEFSNSEDITNTTNTQEGKPVAEVKVEVKSEVKPAVVKDGMTQKDVDDSLPF